MAHVKMDEPCYAAVFIYRYKYRIMKRVTTWPTVRQLTNDTLCQIGVTLLCGSDGGTMLTGVHFITTK